MKTNLLEMRWTNFLTRLETCPSSKRFCTHGTPVPVMHDGVTSDIFIVGLLPSKNIKKKVLCLLIFANIRVLPWGTFGFAVLAKKNSWSHSQFNSFWGINQIKNSNNSQKSHWCSIHIYWIDSYLSCHSWILFPSYLLLTHPSGSKSHAGDCVLNITIFDMSKQQSHSI